MSNNSTNLNKLINKLKAVRLTDKEKAIIATIMQKLIDSHKP